MAEKRRKKDGTTSKRIRPRNPDGSRGSATFARQTEADDFKATVRADTNRGIFIDPKRGKVPFGIFANEAFLPTKNDVAEPTHNNIETRIRLHLDYFAHKPLREIQHSDVLSWQASKKGTRSPTTINACLRTLDQIMSLAVRDRRIPFNPVDGVKPLPAAGSGRDIHPATPDQIVKLADAIDPRFRAAILFDGLGTGLRSGELWALKVSRVNTLKREISVVESLDDRGSKLVTRPPKTGRSRTVRLDQSSVELLAHHLATYPSSDYVFTSAEGMPVRHRNFSRRHFGPAMKAVEDLPEGFTFHDLRHTHASILIADGWRPDQVKERLGHGSIRTTMDTYVHLFEHDDDDQLVALGGKIRTALA